MVQWYLGIFGDLWRVTSKVFVSSWMDKRGGPQFLRAPKEGTKEKGQLFFFTLVHFLWKTDEKLLLRENEKLLGTFPAHLLLPASPMHTWLGAQDHSSEQKSTTRQHDPKMGSPALMRTHCLGVWTRARTFAVNAGRVKSRSFFALFSGMCIVRSTLAKRPLSAFSGNAISKFTFAEGSWGLSSSSFSVVYF